MTKRITVIDSHTAGEPTRLVIDGIPDLGKGTIADRTRIFRDRHDGFRSAIVNEPRGSDVIVGALLLPPTDPAHTAGVIFFNNVGTIGMCGHGTIGLMVSLAHLGRILPGNHRIETPVGVITAALLSSSRVRVRNVPSYRYREHVTVEVPGLGPVTGDIAWGGNWFFLIDNHNLDLTRSRIAGLCDYASRVRHALEANGITGTDGGHIDHIELASPPHNPANSARNFVLCPGLAYDRSPCGTGTSAKLACLHADGMLQPGEVWRQEGILGTVFEGSIELDEGRDAVIPSITGSAYVTAEATLLLHDEDPFRVGIPVGM